MKTTETIKVFEEKQVRTVWDEQCYVSIIDVIEILTDSEDYQTARKH